MGEVDAQDFGVADEGEQAEAEEEKQGNEAAEQTGHGGEGKNEYPEALLRSNSIVERDVAAI